MAVSENPVRDSQALLSRLDSFGSLEKYSFRERVLIRTASLLLTLLIRAIGLTLRIEVIRGKADAPGPQILCFWHNRIPAAAWFWRRRGIVVMSSRSFDSEYTARFIQSFGFGAARGSSTRGARSALIQMIRAVRAGRSAAFSIDGPRGPIYVAKPGAAMLAAKTGAPLVPFSITLDRYWELRTWDRLQIPKPFARALVIIGDPIYVADDRVEVDSKHALLQQALVDVRERSDAEMRNRRVRP
jgi:lysophospholipid acyltransferase (LPLAT)-like uncharacterized protein